MAGATASDGASTSKTRFRGVALTAGARTALMGPAQLGVLSVFPIIYIRRELDVDAGAQDAAANRGQAALRATPPITGWRPKRLRRRRPCVEAPDWGPA